MGISRREKVQGKLEREELLRTVKPSTRDTGTVRELQETSQQGTDWRNTQATR